jgi:hypothetical protein
MTPWFPSAKAQVTGTGAGGGASPSGSAAKSVSSINHRVDTSKAIPWPFSPPQPIGTLQFYRRTVNASVARAATPTRASARLEGSPVPT